MKYTIGLDLGTTSVGWAVIDTEKKQIVNLGVRIFESAENPKDGKSLAEPRRTARSIRRRLARRGHRLDKIKSIFIKSKLLSQEEIEKILTTQNNPYQLRTEGLDRKLTNRELFIATYHLAKRRGYKSNRKKLPEEGESAKESNAVLHSIQKNQKFLKEKGYKTFGEYLYRTLEANKDRVDFEGIRNKSADYKHSIGREDLLAELKLIFENQEKLGNKDAGKIKNDILNTFSFQRHYAQGEGLKEMVGKCTFEKDEIRAAKATYNFQLFNVLQKINNIAILGGKFGKRDLTQEERKKVFKKIYSLASDADFLQIRKELNLSDDERFNLVSYFLSKKDKDKLGEKASVADLNKEIEKKTKFPTFGDFHKIKKILEADKSFFAGRVENLSKEDFVALFDQIAQIFALYKTDEDLNEKLCKISLNGKAFQLPEVVQTALIDKLEFKKFGHLSLQAMRKINPYLEEGLTYDKAIEKADPKYSKNLQNREIKLKPIPKDDHSLTNPVVRRSVSQTIKVVNAIIDKYGSPEKVQIEFARELSKDLRERREIEKRYQENREINDETIEILKNKYNIVDPAKRGDDIVKYKLWKEQGCKCSYSGKTIDENRLYEDNYVQIDHIIPFSRSYDNSYNNKVLVLTEENQNKLNKIPYEIFGHDEDRWQAFENFVNTMSVSPRKKQNLLLKKYVADKLTERTLNDTRYLARYFKNYIEKGLVFSGNERERKVVTVNGIATAYLRKRWGFEKDRRKSDVHHAQDAVVVAVSTNKFIQDIAYYSKLGEIQRYLKLHKTIAEKDRGIGDEKITEEDLKLVNKRIENHEKRANRFPEPWDNFPKDLEEKLSKVFVSRMPVRKVTGQVHDATLRSPKLFTEEKSSVRKPLTTITEKMLLENKSTIDPGIFDDLLKRLRNANGDAKKAFAEAFYKKQKDGTNGPVVRTLKTTESGQKSGILINEGKALVDRQSMIRVDLFSKKNIEGKDEYYFIPVYAYHTKEKTLPCKVVVSGKNEWEEMDTSFEFKFSLYPKDLIKVTRGEDSKYWYYIKAGISTASFSVENHDRSDAISSMGIKTLDKLEKYVVDVLGAYHKVDHELRQPFR